MINRSITIFFIVASLFACASTPPSKTLPQSEIAVKSVDHENYRQYVNQDINAVKLKLKYAKQAALEKEHLVAEQLAQQILADVELIQLRTQRLHREQEVTELESSILNLNDELQWREPIQVSPLNE